MCLDFSLAKKKEADFQVWEVAKHWNALVKRFRKKLGSLPSRTDDISFLYVSPKSNCLTKMAQNSRLWCQRELWIETLQIFLLPENSTRHAATSSCVNVENRDSERYFKLFNHLWWRGSPKCPLAWELEALIGIPTKINHFLWILGISHFDFHFQRQQKFPLAKPWRLPPKNTKSSRVKTLQFLNLTFGGFGFF